MIRTGRLLLREGRAEDLGPLHEIFSDPRAMRYWDRPAHDDLSQTQAFLDQFMAPDPARQFEFILEHEGRCIGKAGIWGAPELGFILHPDCWGRGLMTEALRALLPRAFARFPHLPEITAEIDPRNLASQAVLKKLGFRQTGFARKNFLYGGIELCDTAYFALTRETAAAQSAGVMR